MPSRPPAFSDPPDISQAGTLRAIDGVLQAGLKSSDALFLGGSTPCSPRSGDPREVIDLAARIIVPLDGPDTHAISIRGQRVDVTLLPGQIIFYAPGAWTIPFMNATTAFFCVVFRPAFIRLIQERYPGVPVYQGTLSAYHTTAVPLTGPGTHVLRALNELAEEGNNASPAPELLISLLQLVRRQVAEDTPIHPHQRAIYTWRSIESYLEEHFGHPVTRNSVAGAFNLHPNYLSALAQQVAGRSFRETLEGIRMKQARHLLRNTDLKLARIAALCGFTEVTHFAKAFRRVAGMTPGRFRQQKPADS